MSLRMEAASAKVDESKIYDLEQGITLAKELATAKFDESMDVVIKLGVDPKKGDQVVRVALSMPHGLGKQVKVAVLVADDKIEDAKKSGADIVGNEELIEDIKEKKIQFDCLITTPDMMPKIAPLAKILGPMGLMPNPKTKTVTTDVAAAVTAQKQGQLTARVDKEANLHGVIGKASFDVSKLVENLKAFVVEVNKAKPETSKGTYLKALYISPSMGPSVQLSLADALK